MRAVWTIAKRDLKSYFTSPIAYVVSGVFLAIMGWMFFNNLNWFHTQTLQYQQFNMGGKGMSITNGIVRPLFGNMNVIFLFLVPFITMRLFAEERKNHTIQLPMTSPIKLSHLILGKFLACFALVMGILGMTLVYPAILYFTTNVDPGPVLTGYLGTVLMFSCYLAIGILCSSLTENQIVAAALTFGILLFFWLISWAQQSAGPVWGEILMYLSLISHFRDFSSGMLNSSAVIYYVSFTGVGLFLTHRVLDSYRWR